MYTANNPHIDLSFMASHSGETPLIFSNPIATAQ